MSSFWLCCDPEPAKELKKTDKNANQTTRASSPFLGIFTEDPAHLGRMLPRPQTPFSTEPAPIMTSFEEEENKNATDPIICESPPSGLVFDFEELRHNKSPVQCLISIF